MLRAPPGAGRTPGHVPGRSVMPRPSPRCTPGTVVYRSPAFRQPDLGLAGVRRYLNEQLPAEENMVPTDWPDMAH